jgi:hypothetical protein
MSKRTGEGVDRFSFDFGSINRKSFLFNCDAQALLDLLQGKLTARSLAVMMMMDLNGSQVKSQRAYARILDVSDTVIRNRWSEAIAYAINWITGGGSQWTYELAQKAKNQWPLAFSQWELQCKRKGLASSTSTGTSVRTARFGPLVQIGEKIGSKSTPNQNHMKRGRDGRKTQLKRTTNNTRNQNPENHNTQQNTEGLKKKLIAAGVRDSVASNLLLQYDEDCIVRNLSFYVAKASPKTPGLLVKAIREDYAQSAQLTGGVAQSYRPSSNPLDHKTEEPI